MTKKFSVLELPIYRDYFQIYLEIIEILETKKDTSKHRILIIETYKTIIQIFPNLNAGYNYWGTKGKIKIYNKVRILLSYLQSQLHFLYELKVLEIDYFEEMEGSIRYVGGLIKKMESLPNEK
jgi:hypothetical protein